MALAPGTPSGEMAAATGDTRTVTIPLSQLTEHLGCVICHGLLRDAQTIPECLHSFCKSCIYRHFLVHNSRSCPQCFITLKPRPITTLISDQKLQDVVDRIFPEHKENDARLEAEFYAAHGFAKKDPSTLRTDECNPTVAQSGSRKKNALAPLANGGPRISYPFIIEVYPQQSGGTRPLPELRLPFLHVDGRFKMFDLQKWLRRRLEVSERSEIEVTCMGATVGPELSIHFIRRTMWDVQHDSSERLILHYRLLMP